MKKIQRRIGKPAIRKSCFFNPLLLVGAVFLFLCVSAQGGPQPGSRFNRFYPYLTAPSQPTGTDTDPVQGPTQEALQRAREMMERSILRGQKGERDKAAAEQRIEQADTEIRNQTKKYNAAKAKADNPSATSEEKKAAKEEMAAADDEIRTQQVLKSRAEGDKHKAEEDIKDAEVDAELAKGSIDGNTKRGDAAKQGDGKGGGGSSGSGEDGKTIPPQPPQTSQQPKEESKNTGETAKVQEPTPTNMNPTDQSSNNKNDQVVDLGKAGNEGMRTSPTDTAGEAAAKAAEARAAASQEYLNSLTRSDNGSTGGGSQSNQPSPDNTPAQDPGNSEPKTIGERLSNGTYNKNSGSPMGEAMEQRGGRNVTTAGTSGSPRQATSTSLNEKGTESNAKAGNSPQNKLLKSAVGGDADGGGLADNAGQQGQQGMDSDSARKLLDSIMRGGSSSGPSGSSVPSYSTLMQPPSDLLAQMKQGRGFIGGSTDKQRNYIPKRSTQKNKKR